MNESTLNFCLACLNEGLGEEGALSAASLTQQGYPPLEAVRRTVQSWFRRRIYPSSETYLTNCRGSIHVTALQYQSCESELCAALSLRIVDNRRAKEVKNTYLKNLPKIQQWRAVVWQYVWKMELSHLQFLWERYAQLPRGERSHSAAG